MRKHRKLGRLIGKVLILGSSLCIFEAKLLEFSPNKKAVLLETNKGERFWREVEHIRDSLIDVLDDFRIREEV